MNYEQKYFKIVIYSKNFVSCSGVQTAIFSGTLVIINQLVSNRIPMIGISIIRILMIGISMISILMIRITIILTGWTPQYHSKAKTQF